MSMYTSCMFNPEQMLLGIRAQLYFIALNESATRMGLYTNACSVLLLQIFIKEYNIADNSGKGDKRGMQVIVKHTNTQLRRCHANK